MKGKRDVEKMFCDLSFQERKEITESIMAETVLRKKLGEDASHLEKQLQDLKDSAPSSQAFEWNKWQYESLSQGHRHTRDTLDFYRLKDLKWRLDLTTTMLEAMINHHRDYAFKVFATKEVKLTSKTYISSPQEYVLIMREMAEKDDFKPLKDASDYNLYSMYSYYVGNEVKKAENLGLQPQEKKEVRKMQKRIEELENAIEKAEEAGDNNKAERLCQELETWGEKELEHLPISKQFHETLDSIEDVRGEVEKEIKQTVEEYDKKLHDRLYKPNPKLMEYGIERPESTTEQILEECIKDAGQKMLERLNEFNKRFVKHHPELAKKAYGEDLMRVAES